MNEVEMAIDAIETAFEQEPILEQGYEFYVVIKESLTTALAALREKLERSKGCPVCDGKYADERVSDRYCNCCGRELEEHHDAD